MNSKIIRSPRLVFFSESAAFCEVTSRRVAGMRDSALQWDCPSVLFTPHAGFGIGIAPSEIYIGSIYFWGVIMRTAKLFQNGQSQAVRLPIAVGESGESAVRGRFAGFQEFK